MKILFVHPNIDLPGYQLVGVSTLSALAKKAGHETGLFDISFIETEGLSMNKYWQDKNSVYEGIMNFKSFEGDLSVHQKKKIDLKLAYLQKLSEFQPDIVGISALSTEWHISQLILNFTKEYDPSIFTVVGGRHCIAYPEGTIDHPSTDAVCVGEGEVPFMKLLESISSGVPNYQIPGMWIKDERGCVHKNPLPPYLMNHELDALPYLDTDI